MTLSSKNDNDDGFEPKCELSSAGDGIRTRYIASSTYCREVQLASSTARHWPGPSHKWTSPLNHWRPPRCLVPELLCQRSLKYEHIYRDYLWLIAVKYLLQSMSVSSQTKSERQTTCLSVSFKLNLDKKASIRWQDSARRQFQAGLIGDVGL